MSHVVQIGCGVVGLAYAKAFLEKGLKVSGIEYSKDLVEKYKTQFDMYHVSDDMNKISEVDFILISVCTPLKGDELDMSYLFNTIHNVAVIVKNNPNAFVIIRSTVPPFTTNKYKLILEEKCNLIVKVAFNPEFLRAASAEADASHPWHVTLGVDVDEVDIDPLMNLYTKFVDKKQISIISVEEAELLKIFHNCFNANKISYFNQCYLLCKSINKKNHSNIDMHNISRIMTHTCEGLINKNYGTIPAFAFGGFCLPKDSQELAKLEAEHNLQSKLFQAVVDVNNEMKIHDKKHNILEVLDGPCQISYEEMLKKA